jgi:hypothetical protein
MGQGLALGTGEEILKSLGMPSYAIETGKVDQMGREESSGG